MLPPLAPLMTGDLETDIDLITKYLYTLSTLEGGGAQGLQGVPGADGAQGPQGIQGVQGPPGVPGVNSIKKTSDQSMSVSTDITQLSFNVTAGHTYHIKFAVIGHGNVASGDVGFGLTYPAAIAEASKGIT